MKGKLPDKIKVRNIVYKVSLQDKVFDDDGNSAWGTTGYAECEMNILKSLPYQKQVETLFHEITHAILEQSRYDICNDESIVDPVGKTLEAAVRDNWKTWGEIFESH